MTRYRNAALGAFYVALVIALIFLSIAIYNRDFANVVNVSVQTDSIGSSLQKGSDVEVRGVVVGQVTGVSTSGNGARLSVALDADKARELPTDVTAQLLPKTLFGERYVSLELPPSGPVSGGGGGDTVHAGQVISQDTSAQSIELQQVFNRLLPVLQAVQPEKLSVLLGELSTALRGRGTELGTTVTTFTSYLQEFAPKVPEFTADINALGKFANTYSTAAPDLLSALDGFTTTSQTILTDRVQLASLFDNVTAASNTIGGVVGVNEQNIIAVTRDSIPALTVLKNYSAEFPCVSQALTSFIPIADKALGVGTAHPGLIVNLKVVPQLAGTATRGPANGGPSCPYTAGGSVGSTAAGAVLSGAAKTASGQNFGLPSALSGASEGIGTANSPQENEVIAELMAPTVGLSPAQFPGWSSLLLGPMLRGTQVTVR